MRSLLVFEFLITMFWNLCEHAYLFLILYSTLANPLNLSTQVNRILILNLSRLYGIRPSIKDGTPYFYFGKPQ